MLDREEYVEQAYFFRVLGERLPENVPLQDLLAQVRDETLATTLTGLASVQEVYGSASSEVALSSKASSLRSFAKTVQDQTRPT